MMICPKCGNLLTGIICDCGFKLLNERFTFVGNDANNQALAFKNYKVIEEQIDPGLSTIEPEPEPEPESEPEPEPEPEPGPELRNKNGIIKIVFVVAIIVTVMGFVFFSYIKEKGIMNPIGTEDYIGFQSKLYCKRNDVACLTNNGAVLFSSRFGVPFIDVEQTEIDRYHDEISLWEDIVKIDIAENELLVVGLTSKGTVKVAVAEYSDDEVFNKRREMIKEEAESWQNIVDVQAGSSGIIALCQDGTIKRITSLNPSYHSVVDEWSNIVQIDVNGNLVVGLKSDGTVLNDGDIDTDTEEWTEIRKVFAGKEYEYFGKGTIFGIKEDGTVVAAGNNKYGICNVSAWKNIVELSPAYTQVIGLTEQGTAVATGDNSFGQCKVSDWDDLVAVDTGSYTKYQYANDNFDILSAHTVGLRKDGTVVAVGNNDDGQCEVSDLKNIKAICVGRSISIFLKEDGSIIVKGKDHSIKSEGEQNYESLESANIND